MKISKTHKSLSEQLKNTEVLTNPQKFLGPNWETVLRFWLYFESLTREQKNELLRRYFAIDYNTSDHAWDLVYNVATEVIGKGIWGAVWFVIPFPTALTYELIALHKLEKPFFLPLVVPEFDHKQN
jgi:hypothetical protein